MRGSLGTTFEIGLKQRDYLMSEVIADKKETYFDKVIHLAADEWGSPLMEEIAAKEFDGFGEDKKSLVLTVHEHAGWYLIFAWIGGHVRIVDSANDSAVFSAETKAFWGKLSRADVVYVPGFRRGVKDEH